MKKTNLLFMALALSLLGSCKKDQIRLNESEGDKTQDEYKSQFKTYKKFVPEPTKIKVSDFNQTLQSLLDRKKQNTTTVLRDSVWTDGTGKTLFLESDGLPAVKETIRQRIHLGAIIKGDQIEDVENISPMAIPLTMRNPITIYASFPTDSISRVVAAPAPSQDKSYITAALKAGSGDQLSSFSYSMAQFKRYSEMQLSFGASLNIGSLFNLSFSQDAKIEDNKTRVRAEFTQENFTVNIEPPLYEPFIKEGSDLSIFGDYSPLIVSSITYGRKGIMTVESDSSFNSVKSAVQAVFSIPFVPGTPMDSIALSAHLTQSQIRLIQSSELKTYVIGSDGRDVVQTIRGIEGFAALIINGGRFTPEVPGVPLSYTLSYLSDFAAYRHRFELDVHND